MGSIAFCRQSKTLLVYSVSIVLIPHFSTMLFYFRDFPLPIDISPVPFPVLAIVASVYSVSVTTALLELSVILLY